jgi:hypothetical protein
MSIILTVRTPLSLLASLQMAGPRMYALHAFLLCSLSASGYFARREWSFTTNEIYTRYRCWNNEEAFMQEILTRCPDKIDIGAVFNVEVAHCLICVIFISGSLLFPFFWAHLVVSLFIVYCSLLFVSCDSVASRRIEASTNPSNRKRKSSCSILMRRIMPMCLWRLRRRTSSRASRGP